MGRRLAGRLWEVHSVTPKETVEYVLTIQNEVRDGTMEASYYEAKHKIGEIGNHKLSLATPARLPIRRRT